MELLKPTKENVLWCHTGDGFFVLKAQIKYFLDRCGTLGKPFSPLKESNNLLIFFLEFKPG